MSRAEQVMPPPFAELRARRRGRFLEGLLQFRSNWEDAPYAAVEAKGANATHWYRRGFLRIEKALRVEVANRRPASAPGLPPRRRLTCTGRRFT